MSEKTYQFIRGMGSVLELVPSRGWIHIERGLDLNSAVQEILNCDWQKVAMDFSAAFDCTIKEAEQLNGSPHDR